MTQIFSRYRRNLLYFDHLMRSGARSELKSDNYEPSFN